MMVNEPMRRIKRTKPVRGLPVYFQQINPEGLLTVYVNGYCEILSYGKENSDGMVGVNLNPNDGIPNPIAN